MKLLVIGAGGIGSWLIPRLARLRDYNQLDGLDSITVADSDVIEQKNLPYQNFDLGEVMDEKAISLEDRFDVIGKYARINHQDDLDPYDIIMCAVDNSKTRRLTFLHCHNNPDKYFIDLRAEGSAVFAVTSDAGWSIEQFDMTLGSDDDDDTSCQLAYELDAGIIQLGNTIIAEVGAEWLLNKMRSKKNPTTFTFKF